MIRVLSLMDAEDARKKPGIISSVKKWKRIVAALEAISKSTKDICGLCTARDKDKEYLARISCTPCPFKNCWGYKVGTVEYVDGTVLKAIESSKLILKELQEIAAKEAYAKIVGLRKVSHS